MTLITADPPAPPEPRPSRPATVTVAFWLQLAAVLMLLGLLGLMVAQAVYFDDLITRAVELVPDADPDEVSGERTGNVVTTVVPGVLVLLVAAWLAATAVPVLRGRNVGRILVFVVGGAHVLLCLSPLVLGAAVLPLFLASGPGYEPEYVPEDLPSDGEVWVDSRFYDALYSNTTAAEDAFYAGQAAVTGLEVLLVIAIVVLLAVPPANRWFVPRPAPAWPPMPTGPYPGHPDHPGYPGHPGYPAALPYVICPDPSVHLTPPPAPAEPQRPEE